MNTARTLLFGAALAGTLALAACDPAETTADETATGDSDTTTAEAPNTGGGGASGATLTIDGTTYTYDSFLCVRGYDRTESDVYSYSSTSYTTADGEQIQFLFDVRDPSGDDRIEGDGVEYEFALFDYGNPDSPSVDIAGSATSGVTFTADGYTISGEFSSFDGGPYQVDAEVTCN